MSPETRTALEASIAKWEANLSAKTCGDLAFRAKDCALCQMYNGYIAPKGSGCDLCPVKMRTGKDLCYGSPYEMFGVLLDPNEDAPVGEHLLAAIQAEVDFLKSLLPAGDA